MTPVPVAIQVDAERTVSGLLVLPPQPVALYVMAHGAGAGMSHSFMVNVAAGFHDRGVATLRFQFPYMELGSKRPDRPTLAHATVRAAVSKARVLVPSLSLFAGGKSFGGRMTSQAEAEGKISGVRGLIFLGFPLHPAGKPSDQRGEHLLKVDVPMLFLQGTRDALADEDLLRAAVARLGSRGMLYTVDQADHSFHVPARSGRTDAEALAAALDEAASWICKRS